MIVVIPAYQPDDKLLRLLRDLKTQTDYTLLVVNDGSNDSCNEVFDEARELAIVLSHEVNRGKGVAMKTAFAYISAHFAAGDGIVTADADGQHLVSDIIRVAEAQRKNPDALILGSRRFTGTVPLRSRMGNGITRFVFAASTGGKVYDTQTGLRAFSAARATEMGVLSGERYDYEINQLLYCTKHRIPIIEVTIETVYIGSNESSHFNVVRDSFRIYRVILSFVAASLFCFGVEYVLTLALHGFIKLPFMSFVENLPAPLTLKVVRLTVIPGIARVCSALLNYVLNKRLVFQSQNKASFLRYAFIALAVFSLYSGLLHIAENFLHMPMWAAMIPAQIICYPITFWLQRAFVFAADGKKQNQGADRE